MAGGNRDSGRSVTAKVLSILTAFEYERRPLGLSEIAHNADLPASTAHRLLAELAEADFISRTRDGRYQLGLHIWELAQNVGRQLREAASPFVQELFSLTGETAQLAIRDGNEALFIDRVYGTKRVPRASRVGGRLPLHTSGVGKAILAFENPWVRNAYLNLSLAPATRHTIVHPERLAAELDLAAEQGFATTMEEQRLGACSIAVPVFHTGRVGAGLGLVMRTDQSPTMERHLPVLRAISEQIEKATAHIPLETLLNSHRSDSDRS